MFFLTDIELGTIYAVIMAVHFRVIIPLIVAY